MEIMNSVNSEIKKVVGRVKEAQAQLETLVKSHDWVAEARHYAERQGKEVKKLFGPDVEKIRVFLEHERKELERIQKQIPGEVKKFRKFMDMQKKEFERLLVNLRKLPKNGAKKKAKSSKSKGTTKKKTAGRAAKAPVSVEKTVNP
ncbi:MAG: hypothetical protein HYX41_03075 [Bdellovibrio sp.]|nr:hypothetical protein [Bdellovibrio sp.]